MSMNRHPILHLLFYHAILTVYLWYLAFKHTQTRLTRVTRIYRLKSRKCQLVTAQKSWSTQCIPWFFNEIVSCGSNGFIQSWIVGLIRLNPCLNTPKLFHSALNRSRVLLTPNVQTQTQTSNLNNIVLTMLDCWHHYKLTSTLPTRLRLAKAVRSHDRESSFKTLWTNNEH